MEMNNTVIINGQRYKKNDPEEPRKGYSRNSRLFQLLAATSMMYAPLFEDVKPKTDKSLGIDIIEEYGLIQNKKSKLSRSQRDWVVYQFESNYKKIDETT